MATDDFATMKVRSTASLEGGAVDLFRAGVRRRYLGAEGCGGLFGPCERGLRTVRCEGQARGSGTLLISAQHLPDAPTVAVAPIVGQPVRILGPHGQVVVDPERLRLPETTVLPAAPVSRILPPNALPTSGPLTNYQSDLPLKHLLQAICKHSGFTNGRLNINKIEQKLQKCHIWCPIATSVAIIVRVATIVSRYLAARSRERRARR
jgi:hypothetical protein